MKEDFQKALKKWTLLFLSNPVPLNEQDYEKQKGSGARNQSLYMLLNKFRKISLLVWKISLLPDQDWWCNIKRFLIIPKITSAKLFTPIHVIINYYTFICPFLSGKREKEWKKLRKNWISSEQKELFRWNKKHFS